MLLSIIATIISFSAIAWVAFVQRSINLRLDISEKSLTMTRGKLVDCIELVERNERTLYSIDELVFRLSGNVESLRQEKLDLDIYQRNLQSQSDYFTGKFRVLDESVKRIDEMCDWSMQVEEKIKRLMLPPAPYRSLKKEYLVFESVPPLLVIMLDPSVIGDDALSEPSLRWMDNIQGLAFNATGSHTVIGLNAATDRVIAQWLAEERRVG